MGSTDSTCCGGHGALQQERTTVPLKKQRIKHDRNKAHSISPSISASIDISSSLSQESSISSSIIDSVQSFSEDTNLFQPSSSNDNTSSILTWSNKIEENNTVGNIDLSLFTNYTNSSNIDQCRVRDSIKVCSSLSR